MEDGIPGGLQHYHKTCCKKGGHHGRRAYRVQRWHHHGDVVFQTGGLAYDNLLACVIICHCDKWLPQHLQSEL